MGEGRSLNQKVGSITESDIYKIWREWLSGKVWIRLEHPLDIRDFKGSIWFTTYKGDNTYRLDIWLKEAVFYDLGWNACPSASTPKDGDCILRHLIVDHFDLTCFIKAEQLINGQTL